jgi:hypothetical protein
MGWCASARAPRCIRAACTCRPCTCSRRSGTVPARTLVAGGARLVGHGAGRALLAAGLVGPLGELPPGGDGVASAVVAHKQINVQVLAGPADGHCGGRRVQWRVCVGRGGGGRHTRTQIGARCKRPAGHPDGSPCSQAAATPLRVTAMHAHARTSAIRVGRAASGGRRKVCGAGVAGLVVGGGAAVGAKRTGPAAAARARRLLAWPTVRDCKIQQQQQQQVHACDRFRVPAWCVARAGAVMQLYSSHVEQSCSCTAHM